MNFPAGDIGLKKIYGATADAGSPGGDFPSPFENCDKINAVYDGGFRFPELPGDRTFTLGSFVQSIDGRIAYPESPDGTLVAKSNSADPAGGLADYWVLNMLRTVCDGVLMGGTMIAREPELTGRIYDPDLAGWRRVNGKTPVPVHILVTGRGTSIPPEHPILNEPDIPVLIVTTGTGAEKLFPRLGNHFQLLTGEELETGGLASINKSLTVCEGGEGIDIPELLGLLKKIGLDTMLIESPTFLSNLMSCSMLDELFLNTSGVFIGGNGLSIGDNAPAFTVENHPAARTVSIHCHSDYFFYTRYRMGY